MRWGYGLAASVLILGSVGAEVGYHSQVDFRTAGSRLEATWRKDKAEGVPAPQLAALAHQLTQLVSARWGPIPAAWIPGRLTRPLDGLSQQTTQVMAQATQAARHTASAALTALDGAEGQFAAGVRAERRRTLAKADTPAALDALATRWKRDASQFHMQVIALESAGGPEQDGLPQAVASQLAQLETVESLARSLGVSTTPADSAKRTVEQFQGQPPATQLHQLSSVLDAISDAEDALNTAIDHAEVGGMATLPTILEHYLASRQGNVAVSVYDDVTGQTMSINPDAQFDTASIVKASILGTLLQQAQQHDTTLTAAQEELAVPMIEESNNDDATDLWNEVGGAPAVAAFVHALGMDDTTPNVAWGLTKTTAPNQVQLVKALAYGTPELTPASRAYELSLMENVTSWEAWGVTGGVPSGVTVALKNGWLPRASGWVINSIGWVDGDGRNYVIAILSNADPGEQYGIDTADAVSGLVWNALTPG